MVRSVPQSLLLRRIDSRPAVLHEEQSLGNADGAELRRLSDGSSAPRSPSTRSRNCLCERHTDRALAREPDRGRSSRMKSKGDTDSTDGTDLTGWLLGMENSIRSERGELSRAARIISKQVHKNPGSCEDEISPSMERSVPSVKSVESVPPLLFRPRRKEPTASSAGLSVICVPPGSPVMKADLAIRCVG